MGSRRSVSAKGAPYTSLGHRPRKTDRLFRQGLKARIIKVFFLFLIVRAFSPFKSRDTFPGATLRLPQAGINPRRWRSTEVFRFMRSSLRPCVFATWRLAVDDPCVPGQSSRLASILRLSRSLIGSSPQSRSRKGEEASRNVPAPARGGASRATRGRGGRRRGVRVWAQRGTPERLVPPV